VVRFNLSFGGDSTEGPQERPEIRIIQASIRIAIKQAESLPVLLQLAIITNIFCLFLKEAVLD
jgi:hypothetical protein